MNFDIDNVFHLNMINYNQNYNHSHKRILPSLDKDLVYDRAFYLVRSELH